MIKAIHFKTIYKENYKKLQEMSRIIWWKGNELGYNDNIYNSDDLLHDLYFSLKTSSDNGKILDFENLDHFFAFSYIRMKSLYMAYLRSKWNRSKREKNFFRELGYTYEKADLLNIVFDGNSDDSSFVKGISKQELRKCIEKISNKEHVRILLLKLDDGLNSSIAKTLNLKQGQLRCKMRDARIKLFKILKDSGVLDKEIKFDDFVGLSTKIGRIHRLVRSEKHLYNNYPFDKSYKDKIIFISHKNKGKIDLDLIPEIIKYNEGFEKRRDNRSAINYAIEQVIYENKCYINDGILHLSI